MFGEFLDFFSGRGVLSFEALAAHSSGLARDTLLSRKFF